MRRFLRLATLVLAGALAWGLPQSALAQERTITRTKVEAGPAAPAEPRTALVIGNGAYDNSPLRNPVNDAAAMAKALAQVGFDVIKKINLDQAGMKRAIDEFGAKIKAGGVALFYFAGHGMQVRGRNYLVPIGASPQSENEVDYEAVDAGRVLAKMADSNTRINLVILDACRNNPFARSFRSASQGLAHMDAPSGTLVAYATAPGSVASDGPGENGLYTQELIKTITTPGLQVEQVFKQVRAGVQKLSEGKQTPWESSSLVGNFYFKPEVAAQPQTQPSTSPQTAGASDRPFKVEESGPEVVGRKKLKGSLKVTSNVGGAKFKLGGVEFATEAGSELDIANVPAGQHQVLARKEGYQDWSGQVTVQDQATARLDIQMTPTAKPKPPAQTQTTPPATGTHRTYRDPVLGFSLTSPANWKGGGKAEGTDRVYECANPDESIYIQVRAFPAAPGFTTEAFRPIFEQLLQNTILHGTGQTINLQAGALSGIPGHLGYYRGMYNNIPVTIGAFYTVQNGVGYIVWTAIPSNLYVQRAAEADAVLNTFRIGR